MSILDRNLADECLSMAKVYPVVTIIGPRQSGKTTLVKSIFEPRRRKTPSFMWVM